MLCLAAAKVKWRMQGCAFGLPSRADVIEVPRALWLARFSVGKGIGDSEPIAGFALGGS